MFGEGCAVSSSTMEWHDLSVELVERVLSFLPVPDLCRCRAVCKAWDHVISTPDFRTLAFKNARTGLGYIIARVVVEKQGTGPKFHGWSILDLETRRWYRITHEYSKLDKADVPRVGTYDRFNGCVLTDGGLVCELVAWDFSQGVMSIYNPLMRKRMMRLPDIPGREAANSAMGLMNIFSHDDDGSFSVFWIKNGIAGDVNGEYHIMRVYESRTGRWRSVTNPPLPPEVKLGHPESRCMGSLCVVFQGLLYVVFGWSWLCRYNIVEDLWEDTGVGVAFRDLEISDDYSAPQLLVSDNRLFFLSWVLVIGEEHPVFCAYEVLLADRSLQVVFRMTVTQLRLQFGYRSFGVTRNRGVTFFPDRHILNTEGMGDMQDRWYPDFTTAFGFGESLLLMSHETGISIVYNLVSRSWDRMPTNPMQPRVPEECELWYAAANAINLRLPSGEREESMKGVEEKNKSTGQEW